MWKTTLAGAFALAAVGTMAVPATADEGQIAQVRAALNLTPEQARHWPRVAAALRAAARQVAQKPPSGAASDESVVQRVRNRTAASRVLVAATLLICTLTPEQKQTAQTLARSMGYGQFASGR